MPAVVHLIGLGVGSLRLRYDLATQENLRYLFGIENQGELLLVNESGEELTFSNMKPNNTYHILSEDDLRDDCPYSMDKDQLSEEVIIEAERKQRYRVMRMSEARQTFISTHYKRLHPDLFTFQKSFLDASFLTLWEMGNENKQELMALIHQETIETKLFSFTFFSEDFCDRLMEEVENFEKSGLPVSRPNSMNNYGMVLDDIGFGLFFEALREQYICPLSTLLYRDVVKPLTGHHAFVVKYKLGEDVDLGFHYDMAELTINVCLGKSFTGGSLYFKGLLEDPETHKEHYEYKHRKKIALMHMGKHRHGANPITSGERYNLIVWWR